MLVLVFLGLSLTACLAASPQFPPLSGRIVDEAGLLSQKDEEEIVTDLKGLEEKSSDQIVVYTAKSLQGYTIEDYGYQLGRAWGIGQKNVNNGVVLIVAPKERKVRIEVGRGLEPLMTDAMSKLIIENAILPAFRRGDFAAGIKAGVHDIKDVLLGDAEEVKKRAAARPRKARSAPVSEVALSLFFIAVFLVIVFLVWRSQSHISPYGRYRRAAGGAPIIFPGGWGGWGGGGKGGGGGGGDSGWSGGGGDFGGGGASGDW